MQATATQTHKEHISSCWLEWQKAKAEATLVTLQNQLVIATALGREAGIFYWHREAVFSVFERHLYLLPLARWQNLLLCHTSQYSKF